MWIDRVQLKPTTESHFLRNSIVHKISPTYFELFKIRRMTVSQDFHITKHTICPILKSSLSLFSLKTFVCLKLNFFFQCLQLILSFPLHHCRLFS
jgi:hypothetical protein